MTNNKNKLKLLDLIDIEFLQELQDTFSKTLGLASLTVDSEGPITKPSNFTDFCIKTRKTKEGYKRCNECDIKWGNIANDSGKQIIYDCHLGLRDFAVPISVEGMHIATILGGQVFTKEPNEKYFKKLAKELGVDESEYINALKKIKIVSSETVDSAANFLYLVANTISKIAHKNLELIKKNERERILRDIISKIRKSLNLKLIQHEIVNQIGKFFNADRVIIGYYDHQAQNFFVLKNAEYRSSDKVKSMVDIQLKDTPGFIEYLKAIRLKEKNVIFGDVKKYLEEMKLQGTEIEAYHMKYEINASASVPIYYGDAYLGNLLMSFSHPREFSEDEIEFLEILADQVGIAFHQSKLYEKTKKQVELEKEKIKQEQEIAKRETVLRKITEIINSSLDFKYVQHEIVNQIGKFFNANRVNIGYYDYDSENFFVSKDAEYRSSDTIKPMTGVDFRNIPHFNEYIKEKHLQGQDIIFNDLEKYLYENNLAGNEIEKFYRDYKFIASASTNLYYDGKFIGELVIAFEHPRNFSENEIKFLKNLAVQAGNALYKAKQYEKICKQAERDKFTRSTIDVLRNTLEKNTIKHFLVTKIGEYFRANRVFFADFDSCSNSFLPVIKKAEFLLTSKEKSFVGYSWTNASIDEYIQPLLNKNEFNIPCWNEYLEKEQKSKEFISRFENSNVKSSYNFPVFYNEDLIGFLCIEFTGKVCNILPEEDINIIRNICIQTGIILYRSEWYVKAKNSLEQIGIL